MSILDQSKDERLIFVILESIQFALDKGTELNQTLDQEGLPIGTESLNISGTKKNPILVQLMQ